MSQSYRVVMLTQARRREVEREFPLTCIKCYHAPAGLAIRVRSHMLIVSCDELIGCERVSIEDARCGSTPVQRFSRQRSALSLYDMARPNQSDTLHATTRDRKSVV